jgi:ABC-type transport system substrate-binding protein
MNKTEKNRLLSIILIATFLFMVGSPVLADAQPVFRLDKLNVAPNVDKVVFKVISTEDNMILALQSGAIDLHDSFIEPSTIPVFTADPNIEISERLRPYLYEQCKSPHELDCFSQSFCHGI